MRKADQPGAALGLLDREIQEESLEHSTRQVALPKTAVERGKNSLMIFRLRKEWLGLPTEVFQEISSDCTIRTLPHRRGGVLSGLVNVRGELVLAVALEILLGIEPSGTSINGGKPANHLMVCCHKGDRFAFRVDEVAGVYRYNPEDLKEIPATLSSSEAGAFTIGMLSWQGRTVGCLNSELLFYALNKGLA